jgi:hypothetical protein
MRKPGYFGTAMARAGETRPPIADIAKPESEPFIRLMSKKMPLHAPEQLHTLGALSMKPYCDVQTVSKWADRNYVTK